ncbi:type II toxin-antitoxin system RelE/ParE family toxin [Rhodococcus sp. 077-4]|uniref:type II toxin-antitoxin system RelE/ParE family toxin n=1 Tax=Rhodococcus sp. 077-4 TaxID=2789271 RepID=UPI0039F5A786
MKKVVWIGSSQDDIRAFPTEVKQDFGRELLRVQQGGHPHDATPIKTVGKGVYEIRVRQSNNIYRVFYVASFGDYVYVLHSFVKKTQTTSPKDIAKGQARYTTAQHHAAGT